MIKSDSIIKISVALISAQKEMKKPVKKSENPFFKSKYADLNSVLDACLFPLNSHNIALLQPIKNHDGKQYVETLLLHESGEFIGCEVEVKNQKPNDPQSEASGISYARRYGLQSLLGLSAEDDDGNSATDQLSQKEKDKIKEKLESFTEPQQIIDYHDKLLEYTDPKTKIKICGAYLESDEYKKLYELHANRINKAISDKLKMIDGDKASDDALAGIGKGV